MRIRGSLVSTSVLRMKADARDARAALLLAGVTKTIAEMAYGDTWDIATIDAAMGGLEEAKQAMQRAKEIRASITARLHAKGLPQRLSTRK